MLADRAMLQSLIRASRKRRVTRELCCPECGGNITLAGGRLWCSTTERHGTTPGEQSIGFGELKELAVVA